VARKPWPFVDLRALEHAAGGGHHPTLCIGDTDPGVIGEAALQRLEHPARRDRVLERTHLRQFGQQLDVGRRVRHDPVERIAHLPRQLLQAQLGFAVRLLFGEVADQHQVEQHRQRDSRPDRAHRECGQAQQVARARGACVLAGVGHGRGRRWTGRI
jgi:hypothetical protein